MYLEGRKQFVDTSRRDLNVIHVWKWTWSLMLHGSHVLIFVEYRCELAIQYVSFLCAVGVCLPIVVFEWGAGIVVPSVDVITKGVPAGLL